MQEITDELLKSVQNGNLQDFKKVYDAAGGFVYNVALRVVGNHQDAQEITQDVFLVVYQKIKEFRLESTFKTWIYRITVNRAINYAKTLQSHKWAVEYDEEIHSVAMSADALNTIDHESKEMWIEKMLKQLSPEERMCVVLRNLQGLSYQEMAQTLGININTIRTRLRRARETLMFLSKKVAQHEL